MRAASYGSWPSPVTVDVLASAAVRLGTPTLDGADLYWTESRSDEGGRHTLLRRSADGQRTELTAAPFNVRSRVHEYGGGEYAVRSGTVVFSHAADGRLYVVRDAEPPVALTPAAEHRFADLRVHPDRNLVLAVREDHTAAGDPVNTIVALTLDGSGDPSGTVLCSGSDFYASPELSADGRLAWVEWDHPQMPWDGTRVLVGQLEGHAVVDAEVVAGGPEESCLHPRWSAPGALLFLSDRSGWWNLYSWAGDVLTPLCPAEREFALPPWQLGQSPYAVVDDDRLLVTFSDHGVDSVAQLTLHTSELSQLAPPGTAAASVTVADGQAAAVLSSPERGPRLALLDLQSGGWVDVASSSNTVLGDDMVSLAEPVTWPSDCGPVHGWFYAPTHADLQGEPGTLPPLLTLCHGGPTAHASAGLDLAVQLWTSRGVAVLAVNYGGSSGYGRGYRERLRGQWGVVDVVDCIAGAAALAKAGRVDGQRLAVAGSSSGGYTALRALTTSDVFAAGISRYGVADLEGLATDTHKFEARYLDGLVGPYPEQAQTYRDRSPLHDVSRLNAPILLLQGADDRVVPPNQSEAMAAAARAKGLPVALVSYPGEGHGFRRAENIRSALEAQLSFLGRVFGFEPADSLAPLAIDNLGPA
ncbi:MAG TPA: prolyl oligopeptidase family serine peptidase [Propionibacteriaceae bacterium]